MLSGLDAKVGHGAQHPLSPGETRPMDTLILKYLRMMMAATNPRWAAQWAELGEGVWSVQQSANDEVWKRAKMLPCWKELRVRRLKMWQATAGAKLDEGVYTSNYSQVMAAMLGETTQQLGSRPTMSEEGYLHPTANAWARRMRDDVMGLAGIDSADALLENIYNEERTDINVKELFTTHAGEFREVDLEEIRAKHTSRSIGPQG